MDWVFVGASTIAAQHMLNAVRQQPGHDVTWIVSNSPERVQVWADDHGIACATTNLSEALSDPKVKAVYISSTNEKHHAQATAAISAGKHVLCEKPLGMTQEEAIEMVRAAEAADAVFGTNHHLRCSGSHRAIRDLIAAGRVGQVLSLRIHHAVHLPGNLQGWRINDAGAGGGVIPDIVVHDADVTRFLLQEDPASVVAQMASSGMGQGVEDSCMSVWTMPSGAMVMTHESFTHPFAGSGLEVHGTHGTIFAKGIMTQSPIGDITLVTEAGQENISYSDHDLYVQGVSEFVAAATGQGRPAADGPDGVKSLSVALCVRKAAATGQRVNVDYGGL
ncbi:Gfo/Idh/MocA family oxidoreductase [uncultured Ruegeria sp.]|uniref:Gfo/Idh/MocA family protein n=1 Tax=uncultured Ruegeria sp. TaxID=259304 RepID=UPI002607990C|nr:Gfo/Idh/MocA family oxidoreductase [uncultured Ruegeria sp.]